MNATANIGGVIHTYQKYDPLKFPSPTQPPPDLVSPTMEHLLHYGTMRHFTPEELAKMVKIDASQIAGLMPGLDYLRQKLLDRKKRILEKYETDRVKKLAETAYKEAAKKVTPLLSSSSKTFAKISLSRTTSGLAVRKFADSRTESNSSGRSCGISSPTRSTRGNSSASASRKK